MSDSISTFFSAWAITDKEERLSIIRQVVSAAVRYDDPRTASTIEGDENLCAYIGMFSDNAPGWHARVLSADSTAGMTRALIAFAGPGPDGNEMVQHGQYFVEHDAERIVRMVGFAGTGAPS